MLAKCRCESIATLTALSAPDAYLPRLLLCCGITPTAMLSMINRLESIGGESPDASKYFSQLLTPSVISSWGTGYQAGGRRVVARKLLGRIAAYLDLNGPDTDAAEIRSSPFLIWLTEYCNEAKDKKAPRSKPTSKATTRLPEFLTQIPAKGSLAKLLLDDEEMELDALPFEPDKVPDFVVAKMPGEVFSPSNFTSEAAERAIASNDLLALDSMVATLVHDIESNSNQVQNAPKAARDLLVALSKPVVGDIHGKEQQPHSSANHRGCHVAPSLTMPCPIP